MPSDNNYYILLTDLKTNFNENYSYPAWYVKAASWYSHRMTFITVALGDVSKLIRFDL